MAVYRRTTRYRRKRYGPYRRNQRSYQTRRTAMGFSRRTARNTFRRARLYKQINQRTHTLKSISQDYDLVLNNDGTSNTYFLNYITFVLANETLSALPEIPLSNNTGGGAPVCLRIGAFAGNDQTNWGSVLSQGRIAKVIVKYRPSQTMGVTNVWPEVS